MSLVSWWPLNGNLSDIVGGNDLVNSNTSYNTLTSTGIVDKTYTNSSHSGGILYSKNKVNLGNYQSVFCWINIDTVLSSSNLMSILGQHRYPANAGMGLSLRYISSTTAYLSVNTGDGSSRTYNEYCGETILEAGKWYHVGYTFDNGTLSLYVNGKKETIWLRQSTTASTNTKDYTNASLKKMVISEDFFGAYFWSFSNSAIEASTPGLYNNYTFKGSINDIRIYDHTLSMKEVEDIYSFPILHYTFDDGLSSRSKIYDASGYDSTSLPSSGLTISSETNLGKYSADFNGSSYIIGSNMLSANAKTLSVWVNVSSFPSSNIVLFADKGSKLSFGFYNGNSAIISCSGNAVRTATGVNSLWKTGWNNIVVTKNSSNIFRCFINGTETSYSSTTNEWTHSVDSFYIGARNNGSVANYFTGKISDIEVFITELTPEVIKSMYNTHMRFLNNHSMQAYLLEEKNENMAEKMNKSIFNKSFSNGISPYTQGNCNVTMTDKGIRIYRTPNVTYSSSDANTRTMWGGLRLQFLNLGNLTTVSYTNTSTGQSLTYQKSDFFIKGHRYKLSFHVSGHSNNAMDSGGAGATNNMGWGGGGLAPSPSDVIKKLIPANFGILNGEVVGAEMDCHYFFTINDDIYKTCTTAYSSFVKGNIYPSYRDFAFGFTYESTGAKGTDIYINNIILEDITEKETLAYKFSPESNGSFSSSSFNETTYSNTPIDISDSGISTINKILEVGDHLGPSKINGDTRSISTKTDFLIFNNTKTNLLLGNIADNKTSGNIVTADQVIAYINSL